MRKTAEMTFHVVLELSKGDVWYNTTNS